MGTTHRPVSGGDSTDITEPSLHIGQRNKYLRHIYDTVIEGGTLNTAGPRIRVLSGLCIKAWTEYLHEYSDRDLVDFLAYGWPINFDRRVPLQPTGVNHPSATQHSANIDFYIATELGFGALAGPFAGPPVSGSHTSPLMTRPKKGSEHRRVIVDLSWPDGASINDGITSNCYLDGLASIVLPMVDYMEQRLLRLGRGAFLYKTDLARGYRQLRVDPTDWPLLGAGTWTCALRLGCARPRFSCREPRRPLVLYMANRVFCQGRILTTSGAPKRPGLRPRPRWGPYNA